MEKKLKFLKTLKFFYIFINAQHLKISFSDGQSRTKLHVNDFNWTSEKKFNFLIILTTFRDQSMKNCFLTFSSAIKCCRNYLPVYKEILLRFLHHWLYFCLANEGWNEHINVINRNSLRSFSYWGEKNVTCKGDKLHTYV